MTCVSMGNPHAVVFVDDVEKLPIEFFRGKFFKIFVLKNEEKVVGFG